jgi:hypothetical protein
MGFFIGNPVNFHEKFLSFICRFPAFFSFVQLLHDTMLKQKLILFFLL